MRGRSVCILVPLAACQNTLECHRTASSSPAYHSVPCTLGPGAAAEFPHEAVEQSPLWATGSAYRGRGGCLCTASTCCCVWEMVWGPGGIPQELGRVVCSENPADLHLGHKRGQFHLFKLCFKLHVCNQFSANCDNILNYQHVIFLDFFFLPGMSPPAATSAYMSLSERRVPSLDLCWRCSIRPFRFSIFSSVWGETSTPVALRLLIEAWSSVSSTLTAWTELAGKILCTLKKKKHIWQQLIKACNRKKTNSYQL